MTVKDVLRQLVEELPEEPTEAERRAFCDRLVGIVLPPPSLTWPGFSTATGQVGGQMIDDPEDAGAWSQVSAPAFARDWNSEADQVYDRLR